MDSRRPPARVLRSEVVLVLALSLAASAAYSILDLLSRPIKGQTAVLFVNAGLARQLLDIGFGAVPVFLVFHFLARSGETLGDIGLDGRRAGWDLVEGATL